MAQVVDSPFRKKCLFSQSPNCNSNVKTWKLSVNHPCQKQFVCPSPLDRICGTRRDRAHQLGLSSPKDIFLQNQSFPSLQTHTPNGNGLCKMGESRKYKLDQFRGDSLNSFSFSSPCPKGAFLKSKEVYEVGNDGWVIHHVGGGVPAYHTAIRNPNKAVITINAETTEILVANKMACTLLGLDPETISGKKLCEFFISKTEQFSMNEVEIKDSGELVLISGKVMDLITQNEEVIPVSVWAKHLCRDKMSRCLIVMEPVERTVGTVTFDGKGKILNCDKNFASLFGFLLPQDLNNVDLTDLIPSFILPSQHEGCTLSKDVQKQGVAGKTKDGNAFPLSIRVRVSDSYQQQKDQLNKETNEHQKKQTVQYMGTVWVFANLSGLITVLSDGTIQSINSNFSSMLFGYSESHLVGEDITVIIPTFYDDLEFVDNDSVALPPMENDDDDDNVKCYASDGRSTADSFMTEPSRPVNPLGKRIELMIDAAADELKDLQLSPSPIRNHVCENYSESPDLQEVVEIETFSPTNRKSPLVFSAASESLKSPSKDASSESSSQCIESLRPLSISKSQDTLHSCANSVTESDVNANVLKTPENEDFPQNCEFTKEPKISMLKKIKSGSNTSSFCSDSDDDFSSESDEDNDGHENIVKNFSTPERNRSSCCSSLSISDIKLNNINEIEEEGFSKNFHSEKLDKLSTVCNFSVSTPRENWTSSRNSSLQATNNSEDSIHSIPEGKFYGIALHKDGTDLRITYKIRKAELENGEFLYCLWVSRDEDELENHGDIYRSLTLASSVTSKLSKSVNSSILSLQDSCSSSRLTSSSVDISDDIYTSGLYSEKYSILEQIGKGAFGCVKKAFRNSDGLLVITKFIKKSKVYKELWVFDNKLNSKVPLEVSLLSTVNHPNIVTVLEVLENEHYFQMVMEKHGEGMDLFEFIDRNPKMDEPLASYIFRQVVDGLSYLHSLNIIHRDIKDENIILDQNFHVKLIDFGSATFMDKELFSTFCGTMEYCSPEVILGEKYRGPELEMWALGVTLYTLIFGENPFIDADETIRAELLPPFKVSNELMSLIQHLLHPDPLKRCTLTQAEESPWTNQPIQLEKYKFGEVVDASLEEIDPPKYITDFQFHKIEQNDNEDSVSSKTLNYVDSNEAHATHSSSSKVVHCDLDYDDIIDESEPDSVS